MSTNETPAHETISSIYTTHDRAAEALTRFEAANRRGEGFDGDDVTGRIVVQTDEITVYAQPDGREIAVCDAHGAWACYV